VAGLQVQLHGRVLRLDPRTRLATVAVPAVGEGRSYRADYAAPGEAGTVVAVRPAGSGAEVDVHVTGDMAWRRLADRGGRVDVHCSFAYTAGPDPRGGSVTRVDIS
jgi:hypothetical protein